MRTDIPYPLRSYLNNPLAEFLSFRKNEFRQPGSEYSLVNLDSPKFHHRPFIKDNQ